MRRYASLKAGNFPFQNMSQLSRSRLGQQHVPAEPDTVILIHHGHAYGGSEFHGLRVAGTRRWPAGQNRSRDLKRAGYYSNKTPGKILPSRGLQLSYCKILSDYLLENCGARRAALRPYFFLSFILGSLVRNPSAFSVLRYASESTLQRAREMPWRIAPA